MGLNILIFGATGSAGGSVLRVCLDAPNVTQVRAIARRPLKRKHDKLRVFVHADFLDYAKVREAFVGLDACYFCLGVSSATVRGEAAYRAITYDIALAAARMVKAHSPSAAFHFISGRGTNVNSRVMWARVKGETERDLMQLVGAVCFRPAAIDGEPSETPSWYSPLRPLFRIFRPFRGLYVSGEDLGRAMLQASDERMRSRIIENPEIRDLADRAPRVS